MGIANFSAIAVRAKPHPATETIKRIYENQACPIHNRMLYGYRRCVCRNVRHQCPAGSGWAGCSSQVLCCICIQGYQRPARQAGSRYLHERQGLHQAQWATARPERRPGASTAAAVKIGVFPFAGVTVPFIPHDRMAERIRQMAPPHRALCKARQQPYWLAALSWPYPSA